MNGLPLYTLQDIWANIVGKFPNKTAVVCEGQAYTYREIDALIGRVGQVLRGRFGLGRGDRVAVAMPNSLEFFVAYWATVLSGGAIVPINTRLRAEEMEYVLQKESQEAERKKVEAEGISSYNEIITRSISDKYLQWYYVQALDKLANSENTKTILLPMSANSVPGMTGSYENVPLIVNAG